jgi:hypothetical protein
MPGEDFIQGQMVPLSPGSVRFLSVTTTVNGAASSATQTLASTTGLQAGDKIYFETTADERTILSVDSGTVVTLTATISTTNGETVKKRHYVNDVLNVGQVRITGASGSEVFLVEPDDLESAQGKLWLIVADEGSEPFTVTGFATINGSSTMTFSTTFGAALIQYNSDSKHIAWALPPAV